MSRESLSNRTALEIAKSLRKMLCGYVGDRCDCKYLPDDRNERRNDEQTGCCELREIIAQLEQS